MQRNLHLKKAELEAHQIRALKRILRHAYSSVPFYRRSFDMLGLKPADIETLDDLDRLPIISKADIRRRPRISFPRITLLSILESYPQAVHLGSPYRFT
jgi:phenylacetate-CoA ligase